MSTLNHPQSMSDLDVAARLAPLTELVAPFADSRWQTSGNYVLDRAKTNTEDEWVAEAWQDGVAQFTVAAQHLMPALVAALGDVADYLRTHEEDSPTGREQWNTDLRALITGRLDAVVIPGPAPAAE